MVRLKPDPTDASLRADAQPKASRYAFLVALALVRLLLSPRERYRISKLRRWTMIRRVLLGSVLAASLGVVAMANHPATFVLRNGDRVSGELSYKGGTSYTLNGKDYPSDDIAIIEFVPGAPSAAELNQI